MNQKELIDYVAEMAGISKADADKAVKAVFEGIGDALQRGEEATVAGFGVFKVSENAAREGRNPRTGEPLQIAASKSPKFSAGKRLKDKVNGQTA